MRIQNNIYFEQQNGAEITVGHDKLTYCSGLRRATMVVVEGLCIKIVLSKVLFNELVQIYSF